MVRSLCWSYRDFAGRSIRCAFKHASIDQVQNKTNCFGACCSLPEPLHCTRLVCMRPTQHMVNAIYLWYHVHSRSNIQALIWLAANLIASELAVLACGASFFERLEWPWKSARAVKVQPLELLLLLLQLSLLPRQLLFYRPLSCNHCCALREEHIIPCTTSHETYS